MRTECNKPAMTSDDDDEDPASRKTSLLPHQNRMCLLAKGDCAARRAAARISSARWACQLQEAAASPRGLASRDSGAGFLHGMPARLPRRSLAVPPGHPRNTDGGKGLSAAADTGTSRRLVPSGATMQGERSSTEREDKEHVPGSPEADNLCLPHPLRPLRSRAMTAAGFLGAPAGASFAEAWCILMSFRSERGRRAEARRGARTFAPGVPANGLDPSHGMESRKRRGLRPRIFLMTQAIILRLDPNSGVKRIGF